MGGSPACAEVPAVCAGIQPSSSPMSESATLREQRLAKLQRLKELGMDPFVQEGFAHSHTAAQLVEGFDTLAPAEEAPLEEKQAAAIRFAGRLTSHQRHGKAGFCFISDGDSHIQAYFRRDDLPEVQWEAFKELDPGDHVGVAGWLFRTKTGEKTIHVMDLTPLSKCLEPIPFAKEKDGHTWYALEDVDKRYRHRHLDLILNHEARGRLLNRSRLISAVRAYFLQEGFLEVETPILQTEAGGATARKFSTHYNAYKIDVQLRVAPELHLKRILCGDVPKVFEIARVFRNEGVSSRHNPEFTLLEWYESYVGLETNQRRVEEVFAHAAKAVFGSTQVTLAGHAIDFSRPWARIDLLQAIQERSGITPDELTSVDSAKAAMKRAGLDPSKESHVGGIIEKLLEVFVEPHLIQPTFVVGYPIETSPLAKKDFSRPGFTRRSEGYILGKEVCNMFSELNDPLDQRERFAQQAKEKAGGDEEAQPHDEDFVYALECGMPPAGGCGIGIDRMVMFLTGAEHIREVLMFPMMKPLGAE